MRQWHIETMAIMCGTKVNRGSFSSKQLLLFGFAGHGYCVYAWGLCMAAWCLVPSACQPWPEAASPQCVSQSSWSTGIKARSWSSLLRADLHSHAHSLLNDVAENWCAKTCNPTWMRQNMSFPYKTQEQSDTGWIMMNHRLFYHIIKY